MEEFNRKYDEVMLKYGFALNVLETNLKNLFKEYEPLYIIGHKNPDVDSVVSTKILTNILKSKDTQSISQFQALCTALSATIGTGNIAGIAYAVYRYLAAKEMKELEAEFADEFDEDFFDEDDDIVVDDVFDEV